MRIKFWIFLAILTSWTAAHAQDLKDIPPPTLPLVTAVPENADWTVTVQNPAQPTPPPPAPGAPVRVDQRISEIHSTKTGNLKRELITYINGTTEERWYVGAFYLWTPPLQEVSVFDLNNTPAGPDGSRNIGANSGFTGVGWLKLDHYDKVVLYESSPCYHYQNAPGGTEAWIDVKTKLPAAYKDADTLYKFKFNPAPTSPLTLPPAYQKAWDECQVILKNRR